MKFSPTATLAACTVAFPWTAEARESGGRLTRPDASDRLKSSRPLADRKARRATDLLTKTGGGESLVTKKTGRESLPLKDGRLANAGRPKLRNRGGLGMSAISDTVAGETPLRCLVSQHGSASDANAAPDAGILDECPDGMYCVSSVDVQDASGLIIGECTPIDDGSLAARKLQQTYELLQGDIEVPLQNNLPTYYDCPATGSYPCPDTIDTEGDFVLYCRGYQSCSNKDIQDFKGPETDLSQGDVIQCIGEESCEGLELLGYGEPQNLDPDNFERTQPFVLCRGKGACNDARFTQTDVKCLSYRDGPLIKGGPPPSYLSTCENMSLEEGSVSCDGPEACRGAKFSYSFIDCFDSGCEAISDPILFGGISCYYDCGGLATINSRTYCRYENACDGLMEICIFGFGGNYGCQDPLPLEQDICRFCMDSAICPESDSEGPNGNCSDEQFDQMCDAVAGFWQDFYGDENFDVCSEISFKRPDGSHACSSCASDPEPPVDPPAPNTCVADSSSVTVVDSCGYVAKEDGAQLVLDYSLGCVANQDGIRITGDGVTLNCQGYSIFMAEDALPRDHGIVISGTNVKVMNCDVSGFDDGIRGSRKNQITVLENVHASGNNRGARFALGDSLTIVDSSFNDNLSTETAAIRINEVQQVVMKNVTVSDNANGGIDLRNGVSAVLIDSNVNANGAEGTKLMKQSSAILQNSVVCGNTGFDIDGNKNTPVSGFGSTCSLLDGNGVDPSVCSCQCESDEFVLGEEAVVVDFDI